MASYTSVTDNSGIIHLHLPGKARPLKEAYVPGQQSVSRSLMDTDSSISLHIGYELTS